MTSVWLSPDLKRLNPGPAPGLAAVVDPGRMPCGRIALRRSGGRPLVFQGMLLIEQTATDIEGAVRRHVIRVYETEGGAFVVEVTLAAGDGDGVPHTIAAEVSTLAEAEDFLRDYDPDDQAALTLTLDDPARDAFSIGEMAHALRNDADRLRQDFAILRDGLLASSRFDENDTSRRVN
jgi:hypothetical protein